MHWLEIIHVRPTGTKEQALAHLASMRAQGAAMPGLVDARVYAQTGLQADVALHLVWGAGQAGHRSDLGRAIAESLRAFGLVDHSVWKEELP